MGSLRLAARPKGYGSAGRKPEPYTGPVMRRLRPPSPPEESIREFERMQAEGLGLRLLLPFLPAGAALGDARAFHARMAQAGRPHCSFMGTERRAELDAEIDAEIDD